VQDFVPQQEQMLPSSGITLPAQLDNVADVKDTAVSVLGSEIPFLWHVPFGGGAAAMLYMGICLGLTQASNKGTNQGREFLVAVETNIGRYINVDTFTMEGIHRAKRLGLMSPPNTNGGVAVDIIHTGSDVLYDVTDALFTPSHRGRMMALFREPIESLVLWFNFVNSHEEFKGISGLSIEDYAKSDGDRREFNWLTKYLSQYQDDDDLSMHHLNVAKEVIREKFLVGLVDQMEVSMWRFQATFGWQQQDLSRSAHTQAECDDWANPNTNSSTDWANPNPNSSTDGLQQKVIEGSETYELLKEKISFDIHLYDFIVEIFDLQGNMFG